MARVKLSEFDAKRLLFPTQKVFSASTSTTSGELKKFFGEAKLVVKVDQGIKKRGIKGLVKADLDPKHVINNIRIWSDQGYSHFVVEPFVIHAKKEEKYLSLERTRYGWVALNSNQGGIDIEENWDSVDSVDPKRFESLTQQLEKYHIATLEINPYIVREDDIFALDSAAEIDDAALGLADISPLNIVPAKTRTKSPSETKISELDDSTPASLKFRLINKMAKIWVLLSGGGASLVLADEVADIGLGQELANYGEYSGAPSEDDTYNYTKIVLQQLLQASSHQPRAIIIAGGVANFTDVAKTFRGIIRALDNKKTELKKSNVKIFVRRGGPNEKKGLANMEKFLKDADLLGSIHGHETPLTDVVEEVKKYLGTSGTLLAGKGSPKRKVPTGDNS